MKITPFPLAWPEGWPRSKTREKSRFKTEFLDAWANLIKQLKLFGAIDVIASSNAPVSAKTGRPYADAMDDHLADPGVAVWFKIDGEQRVMARDGHPTPAENIHAIGHVIEAMRNIERHGGAFMLKRSVSGFTALPAPGSKSWWEVLGIDHRAGLHEIDAAYRHLAAERHPDKPGGSESMMAELNAARDAARKERG